MARASKLTKSICSGAALMREGPLETRSSWPGWRITFNVSGGDGVSSKRRFRLESEEGDGAECCSGAEFECVDSGCPLESDSFPLPGRFWHFHKRMRALSLEEASKWCENRRLVMKESYLRFSVGPTRAVVLPLPGAPHKVPWFIVNLLDIDLNSPTEYLLWIREWEIWSEWMTEIGIDHLEQLRRAHGIEAPLSEKPALLFEKSDVKGAVFLSMLPVLFSWDAYLIPRDRDHFAFISHDEWACVYVSDERGQEAILSKLREWNPRAQPLPCGA